MFDIISGIIGAVGIGISLFGASEQADAAAAQAAAQRQANADQVAHQRKTEAIRLEAMNIDADRKRRAMIRESIIARSQALSATTAKGASQGSALPGALGTIGGELGFGIAGVNAQQRLGLQMFTANNEYLDARLRNAAAIESAQVDMANAQAWSAIGGTLTNNSERLGRIGGNFLGSGFFSSSPSPSSYGGFIRGIGSNGIY
jgi:hypothetical protein